MKLTNFPILIPAFTAQIYIDTPLVIKADLLNIPFVPKMGTLVSEPGYEPPLEAAFVQGSDFLRRDPDGQRVRLDVSSVAHDTSSGAMVRFSYNGVVGLMGDEGRVIRGDANATTTGFGNACRFIVEEDKPIIVEYKISEVGAQCSEESEGD
ncbi:hypothetical protein FALBO_11844 [Fusarium albosuccineum]|uniref:Uncharacterized protein n=1 Tax=Fusarium albosuccineum TaxID=1237068 RepID=A0A8H4P3Q5_9HYPO|nr:hypothetical protein FALBO_11844 [Fusarium albosuccineum]